MNRNIWIWAVVVVVVLLGIWYFASSGTASPANTAATSSASGATTTSGASGSAASGSAGSTSSFRSIFTQNGNYECTYDLVGTSTSATSKINIADGKMRGEFRSTTGGASIANYMIYTGGYLYSWKEAATTGTKTSVKTLSDLPSVIPGDLTSASILGASGSDNIGWNCHNWAKDASAFTLPSYVKFSAR